MEERVSWRYFFLFLGAVIIIIVVGDHNLRSQLANDPSIYHSIRPKLYLGGGLLISIFTLFFMILQRRIFQPVNDLVKNIKQRLDGSENVIEPLHSSTDISPLLYAIEILINSYLLQVQDAESEIEILRSVLNQITDGIVMVDSSGLISSMNPAAEKIFKVTNTEVQGRTVAEALRQHQWIELYRHCRDTNQESAVTVEIPSQNIFLQGIAIPPGESLPGYTLMVFQDLSQIRRLETTRQDFISNISHELRTPLASLKTLTETLQEGALDDQEASRRFLGRMDTEVDALAQMVTELLELSRIESGKVPLDLKPIAPKDLIQNAQERMRAQAERKKIRFENEVKTDLPQIMADSRRIEQVLVNLLHNAIKFSEPHSRIILSAWREDDEIIFSVEDFGTGIPEPDLDRIFERFYKTDQARSSGGTGLGLSISKHLVEAHQGQIWAESVFNQGSNFFFSVPLSTPLV